MTVHTRTIDPVTRVIVRAVRRVAAWTIRPTTEALEWHAPADGVTTRSGVMFGAGAGRGRYDVYRPAGAGSSILPIVVWVHGGSWIVGARTDAGPYLRLIAAAGYTVIGVGYSLAPEARHPAAIAQLTEALRHIRMHAEWLGGDASRIVLAGDSSGAHLASQLA